jgi:uncharacterized protein (DUF433 family)
MRIRVVDVLETLAADVTVEELLDDFPDLELEDIQACLLYAAQAVAKQAVAKRDTGATT